MTLRIKTQKDITAGYCHKCGKLVALKYRNKSKFSICSYCGYQNVMEDLDKFLRPFAKPNTWNTQVKE